MDEYNVNSKETSKAKRKQWSKRIIPVLLAVALVITGVFAFLTATDSLTNRFTLGVLNITVTETNWSENAASAMQFNSSLPKNPAITNVASNNGGVDAYMYMAVKIPKTTSPYLTYNSQTDTYTRVDPVSPVDIFETQWYNGTSAYISAYNQGDSNADPVDPGWTYFGVDSSNANYNVYYYYYNDVVPAGESTSELFDRVYIRNFIGDEYDEDQALARYIQALIADAEERYNDYGYYAPFYADDPDIATKQATAASVYNSYVTNLPADPTYAQIINTFLSAGNYTRNDILNDTGTFAATWRAHYDSFGSYEDGIANSGVGLTKISIDGTTQQVVVTGYAIQSNGLPSGVDDAADAWNLLANQSSSVPNTAPTITPVEP